MTHRQDTSDAASDETLARAAQAGDAEALHALADRHAAPLLRAARRLVGSETDAEDLVQETLMGMVRNIASFGGQSAFRTWLWAILLRQSAGHHRKRAAPRSASDQEMAQHSASGDAQASVAARLDVTAAMQLLSPEHRQVLVLREMQGMRYAEIAQVLGVAQGTVESRLHRARQELRRRLAAYEDTGQ